MNQVSQSESLRFAFGENWARFLTVLDDDRIQEAERSLCEMLQVERLDGKRFLDIGSGSGLFSLAARRLGATVHSFDFDPHSVACTAELKRRYFPEDLDWIVDQGSVLDKAYLESLGMFDIVYSWGVLHHTGAMWLGIENAIARIAAGGLFFIAIYNDQGGTSQRWRIIKQTYNALPIYLRSFFAILIMGPVELKSYLLLAIKGIALRANPFAFLGPLWNYSKFSGRGMSRWHDMVDWVGGYPFEVAKPEDIFEFCKHQQLMLERMKTCGGGLGCNQYIFSKLEIRPWKV